MSGVAIVAIPSQNDYVWKISSEKVPHMTMLFLGEISDGEVLLRMEEFVKHVVETSMYRFGLSVDRRGTLGPDQADVLFFDDDYGYMVATAREQMLQNRDIRTAFDAIPQYEDWTPHLTLGYPPTPAREDTRDYPGFSWVSFDRIALWTGDYAGPEFLLPDERGDLAMSDLVNKVLAHHGVKGMKWGVRKDRPHEVTVTQKLGKPLKSSGGHGLKAHQDAVAAQIARQKARSSSVHALSNHELKQVVERMNLEQQYARLSGKPKGEGRKFAEEQLKSIGRQKIASTIAKKAAKSASVAAALA